MDTTSCELGAALLSNVSNQINTSIGCSICGTAGILRRGWCEMHYQRWYRTGDPNKVRRSTVSVDGKKTFTAAMWARWLAEFNAPPDPMAVQNIESVRNSIEKVERSTWNKHHGVPRR